MDIHCRMSPARRTMKACKSLTLKDRPETHGMPTFEFSRWDGTEEFSPQSADSVFDQLSQYLLDYGDEVLPMLDRLEQEHPDVLDKLIRQGYIEKDIDGKFQVTSRGVHRVETQALDELFDVTGRDKLGK